MLLKIQISFNSGSARGEPTHLISLQQMLQINIQIQLKNLPFCSLGARVMLNVDFTNRELEGGKSTVNRIKRRLSYLESFCLKCCITNTSQ